MICPALPKWLLRLLLFRLILIVFNHVVELLCVHASAIDGPSHLVNQNLHRACSSDQVFSMCACNQSASCAFRGIRVERKPPPVISGLYAFCQKSNFFSQVMATLNFQHVLTPQWTLLIRCTTMHFAAWMLLSMHMAPSSGKVKSLSNMERSSPGMLSPLDSSSGSSFGKDGSSAVSFYSSTLTVSCTNLPTSFPISFSSSSIPVFSFPESLRNVSVAFLLHSGCSSLISSRGPKFSVAIDAQG